MPEDIVKGVSRALARGVSRAVLALCAAASAVTFDVDVEGVRPALLEAYRGESFEIAARFPQDFGVSSARFLWMTNTAADADVFSTNATVSADGVVRTVFTGAMDAGAPVVPFFFACATRVGTCLRASGMIRFRPSPGVSPSTEPFPSASRTLDFSQIEALNAPWTTWEAVEALVRDATNGIPAPPSAPDLSPYATKEEVASEIAASTNAVVASIPQPDLAPYCTIEAARAMDAAVSNTLAEAIASIRVPSLDGYATEAWVSAALAGISQPDLSPYATKEYADAAAANAVAGVNVPSLDGYATETYVDAKVSAVPVPDLSPYATKAYADAAASNAVAGVNVPSLDGYATETYVDEKVSAIPAPDLSPYATKAYADAAAADAAAGVQVPSLEGYATKSELDALKRRYADTNGVTRLWSEDGLTMTDGTGVVWSVSWASVTNWVSLTNGIVYRPTAPGVWIGDGIITNGEGAVGVGRIEYGRGMPEWFAFGLDGGGSYADAGAEGLYLDYSDAVAMLPDAFTGVVERAALYVPMARVVTNAVGYVANGIDTNAVNDLITSATKGLATKADLAGHVPSRAETFGTDSLWTDATGVVWRAAFDPWRDYWTIEPKDVAEKYDVLVGLDGDFTWTIGVTSDVEGSLNGTRQYFRTGYGTNTYSFTIDLAYTSTRPMITAVRHPGGKTEAVGRVAYTNDIPDVSGYATPEDVSTAADSAVATANAYTDGQTTPLWSYLGAESFRVVVTNYDSAVHPPVASFEYRMTTNEAFRTVWNETDGLNRAIATATNLAHQAAKQLADDPANRAWGKYDSETGEASPEGVIQATAPGGLIVGGGQRWSQISAESGWWILTSTDPTLCRTGTNGVFSIIGSDGQEAIRIVKGDKVTVPAPADGISVASGVCTVTYAVEAEQHPTARFASEIGGDAGTVWYNEDDADCPVTMTWSGTSGNYVLTFDTAGLSAGFVQAAYEQGQESYTSFGGAGLEITKIRIGGKVYTVGTATIDGKTVLTLE